MNAPMPHKAKMPNLDLYDETIDPKEHLGVYKAQMYVKDVDNMAYCRYFSATLKGVARKSFNARHLGALRASRSYMIALSASS